MREEVDDGCVLGFLVQVLLALVLGDQRPELPPVSIMHSYVRRTLQETDLVKVDDRLPLVVAE